MWTSSFTCGKLNQVVHFLFDTETTTYTNPLKQFALLIKKPRALSSCLRQFFFINFTFLPAKLLHSQQKAPMFLQTAKCGVSTGEAECYFTERLEEKAVGTDWQGLNRESFLFCFTSNVPRRIKLCASLAELLPTQTVQNNKSAWVSCTFHQTCGGSHLRHLQGFSELLRHFWPPVFVNSLTDEE